MEKYCQNCGRVFKDSDFKLCPYCGNQLSTRVGRQPIPRKLRHQVFQRDNYRCRECGATNKQTRLHVDHIVPVAKGGTNDLSNLQTLCEACNRAKYTDVWVGGQIPHKNNEVHNKKKYYAYDSPERRICPKCGYANPLSLSKCWHCEEDLKKAETKKLLFNTLSESDINLISEEFNFKKSKEEVIEYLSYSYDNKHDVDLLINRLLEKKNKNDLKNSLTDNFSDMDISLFSNYLGLNNSKDDVIHYLVENYSKERIQTMRSNLLDNHQNKKIKHFDKDGLSFDYPDYYEISNYQSNDEIYKTIISLTNGEKCEIYIMEYRESTFDDQVRWNIPLLEEYLKRQGYKNIKLNNNRLPYCFDVETKVSLLRKNKSTILFNFEHNNVIIIGGNVLDNSRYDFLGDIEIINYSLSRATTQIFNKNNNQNKKTCPYCGKEIKESAVICQYCLKSVN